MFSKHSSLILHRDEEVSRDIEFKFLASGASSFKTTYLSFIFSNFTTLSVYLGTSINKHQIMPQKTNHVRTAFILFPGHPKQPYSFLVRCPDE